MDVRVTIAKTGAEQTIVGGWEYTMGEDALMESASEFMIQQGVTVGRKKKYYKPKETEANTWEKPGAATVGCCKG